MAGKTYIKTGSYSWGRIPKIYYKSGGSTWTLVRKAYYKTSSGWRKVYDTASNAPYLANNDKPIIRLNSYRSSGYIDAAPVQQMGPPTTNPTSGWPYETVGDELWGANASNLANWVNPVSGTTITYAYQWFWNMTGNSNDNSPINYYLSNTSDNGNRNTTSNKPSGATDYDKFKNTISYLGYNDGNSHDKNWITFKVWAINGTNRWSAWESNPVYIVRQLPSGSISIINPSEAILNSTMSATFSFNNLWYKRADTSNSYVEWFAVNDPNDSTLLTTTNRVQIETLSSFSFLTSGNDKTATTYHVPTIANKYYVVRLTLNNSNTMPAVVSSTSNWSGFTPNSPVVLKSSKTSLTSQQLGPFNLTQVTKYMPGYNSSYPSSRGVSVNIGKSDGADRYELQVEGRYPIVSGSYDFTNTAWTIAMSYNSSAYYYESSRSINDLIVYAQEYSGAINIGNYYEYRVTARASKTGSSQYVYSNSNLPQTASGFAPSAPSISNAVTATDSLGSYVTFNNSISSFGSNSASYYEYSFDNGTTWNSNPTNGYINDTSGKIYGTSGQYVNLRIRVTNKDEYTSSSSNLLSFTFPSQPGNTTAVIIKSFSGLTGTIFFTAGSNTQSVQGWLEYDSFSTFDSITAYSNTSSGSPGKIQLIGANSSSKTYYSYTQAFSGTNKTGNQGSINSYSTKILNGSDAMNTTLNTPVLNSARSMTFTWSLTSGSPTYYQANLINYNTGNTVSTKIITETGMSANRTVTFTDLDGVAYNTTYYLLLLPYYEYASGVTYGLSSSPFDERNQRASANITSGSNLYPPTYVTVNSVSRYDDTSVLTELYHSGGSGPYYQMYWTSSTTTPTISNYDAASTNSNYISDGGWVATANLTYYFYVRSSSENLGNTYAAGSATAGTYSSYTNYSTNASYYFTAPSGGNISSTNSSGTTISTINNGSTIYTSITSPSASPSASSYVLNWRRADGGTGGNSFTGGSIRQYGGTSYTTTSADLGYSIRPEITWNNGVGFASANGNAVLVSQPLPAVPSITNVQYDGAGTWTITVSGGGPYYQVYWLSSNTYPTGTYYDAASTTTTITESLSTTGSMYWWARSSNQNLGNTTTSGNASANTYSDYSTAYWAHQVIYDYNGGSGTTFRQTVKDSTYTTLPTPSSRTGYTFNGWYTASSGGTYLGGSGSSTYITSSQTIYAQWTTQTYTISYSGNSNTGGSAPSSPTSVNYNSTFTVPSNSYTRTGYTFSSWLSSQNNTTYTPGQTHPAVTGNLTLTAQWTQNATAPTAPTSLSVTAGSYNSRNLYTDLTRNSNTNKTQSWSVYVNRSVTVSWTKGTGTGTITSEVRWNQTGITPSSSDTGTWTGIAGSSQTDSNSADSTNYYWVRTKDGNGNYSAWTYAGSYSVTATMSGFSIRIYRGNGTTYSNPTTAPSTTSTSGSYVWTVTDRGNPATGGEGHYAWAGGTLNGLAVTATSATV